MVHHHLHRQKLNKCVVRQKSTVMSSREKRRRSWRPRDLLVALPLWMWSSSSSLASPSSSSTSSPSSSSPWNHHHSQYHPIFRPNSLLVALSFRIWSIFSSSSSLISSSSSSTLSSPSPSPSDHHHNGHHPCSPFIVNPIFFITIINPIDITIIIMSIGSSNLSFASKMLVYTTFILVYSNTVTRWTRYRLTTLQRSPRDYFGIKW